MAFLTILNTCAAYSNSWAGPLKNQLKRPANAMRPPLKSGKRRGGPTLKKSQDEGYEIAFIDESAFYLLPAVVRTYAPCGLTPVLSAPLSYDHLSVISA